jgi:hypothetical protein
VALLSAHSAFPTLAPFSSLSELVEHYCNEFLCDDMALQRPVAAVGAVRRSSVEELTAVAALTTFAANGPNELSW